MTYTISREGWPEGAIKSRGTVNFGVRTISNNQYWVTNLKNRTSIFRSSNNGMVLSWIRNEVCQICPRAGSDGLEVDNGFLFDNYWLALGYFLRLRENLLKQQEEKNETKRS